jgi:hypothetical protein
MAMKPVRYRIGKLAGTLTLAVAALLLPASLASAGQGHGGGHVGSVGSGFSTHHTHHLNAGGYFSTWGGYYPGWGYDSYYGGDYGFGIYSGNNPAFGIFSGNNPALGVYTPYWGVSPVVPTNAYGTTNFMGVFP